jgi:hypothetical protein
MNDLQNTSFEKLLAVYRKYFSLHYLNSDIGDKLACIALTCYITNEMRKRGKAITCYEVLLKVGNNFGELEKETFLKSLGAICEDLMYGCKTFTDFGIKLEDMPKTLQKLLNNYVPF